MLPILTQSFWRDEAFSALIAQKNPLQIISLVTRDVSPGILHYLILHYWTLFFGNNEVTIRSLSFLFHICTVISVFFLARQLTKSNKVTAFISIAVFLNPFLLQYAFEGRAYSLLAFLTVTALYFVVIRRYIISSILLALLILTHDYGVFTVISFGAWWLVVNRENLQHKVAEWSKLFLLPFVTLLFWGSIIYSQWEKVAGGFWIKPVTTDILLRTLGEFTRGTYDYSLRSGIFLVSLLLIGFSFSYWFISKKEEGEKNKMLLFFLVAFLPVIMSFCISAFFAPIYLERYLIATVPITIVIVGFSIFRLYKENIAVRNYLIAIIAIYLAFLFQGAQEIVATSVKPPINYAVSQSLLDAKKGDIIIPASSLNFLETKYYAEKNTKHIQVFTYAPTGKIPFYLGSVLFDRREILKKIPPHQRVWIIFQDGGHELLNSDDKNFLSHFQI